jgi:hypothetical protein
MVNIAIVKKLDKYLLRSIKDPRDLLDTKDSLTSYKSEIVPAIGEAIQHNGILYKVAQKAYVIGDIRDDGNPRYAPIWLVQVDYIHLTDRTLKTHVHCPICMQHGLLFDGIPDPDCAKCQGAGQIPNPHYKGETS